MNKKCDIPSTPMEYIPFLEIFNVVWALVPTGVGVLASRWSRIGEEQRTQDTMGLAALVLSIQQYQFRHLYSNQTFTSSQVTTFRTTNHSMSKGTGPGQSSDTVVIVDDGSNHGSGSTRS
ncbi:hypothetical protein M407DRAFT_19836 [Tulasnella calospora MUT 4182]|uniref:Uncharacterized protein n=1 Tax=Tulasnella calospora MUT 4182 TaxID=1051891 RepID=A0A0C3LBG8_9AGAM|nr:hypothetical protein M407DRAFT_19836 [Tulasnella calospora MUT 4182]